MLQYARNAHSWYKEACEKSKKDEENYNKEKALQKRSATVIQELKVKKTKIMTDALKESARISMKK